MMRSLARVAAFTVTLGIVSTAISLVPLEYGTADPPNISDGIVTFFSVLSLFLYPIALNLNWWLTFGLLFFVLHRRHSMSTST